MNRDIRAEQLLSLTTEDVTIHTKLWGAPELAPLNADRHLPKEPHHSYGTDAPLLASLPGAQRWLAPGLSEAMVRFAARYEYARTVEDVLARRSRLLFLDAQAAMAVASEVAGILTSETGGSAQLAAFESMAKGYLIHG